MLKNTLVITTKKQGLALNILNDEQIATIKEKLNKGGEEMNDVLWKPDEINKSVLKNQMIF